MPTAVLADQHHRFLSTCLLGTRVRIARLTGGGNVPSVRPPLPGGEAAPQDLVDKAGGRLSLTFNDAVSHVAALRDWHGHDGGDFASDAALYDAVVERKVRQVMTFAGVLGTSTTSVTPRRARW